MDIQAANNLVGTYSNEVPVQYYNVSPMEKAETSLPQEVGSTMESPASESASSSLPSGCVDTYA